MKMQPISKLRFDLLAGYTRHPAMSTLLEELCWFAAENENLLALIARDREDGDYFSIILGRDAHGRFRAVTLPDYQPTLEETRTQLEVQIGQMVQLPAAEFYQGDEIGSPCDFFTPVVPPQKLNSGFRTLIGSTHLSPARALLTEMMHYYNDIDGNFVEQFQSSGFDSRIWELYLFALFTELEYGFKHDNVAPDFHCHGLRGDLFIEATTVNPSPNAPEVDDSSMDDYVNHYVAIKYGSALYSKLKKKHKGKQYWELDQVIGHPFAIAIQDFHAPQSMSWTSSILLEYLFGVRQDERVQEVGSSEIRNERVDKYQWGKKEIPAGFFDLEDAENISAIIANATGTVSKINRMGYIGGFGERLSTFKRAGFCYRNGEIDTYSLDINAPNYIESWCEGLSVYHNPNALIPLAFDMIPGAAHYSFRDGLIFCQLPEFYPFTNTTLSAP